MHSRNKKVWYTHLSPLITIIFLGTLALLFLATSIGVIQNISLTKEKITIQERTNSNLMHKYHNLSPNETLTNQAKFDLQSHEKKLTTIYSPLVEELFGKRDANWFNKNKLVLTNYFGKNGYTKVKNMLAPEMISKIDTYNITFSDFNYKDKSIKITIYASYKLDTDYNVSTQGAGYLEIKYSFDNNSGELINGYVKDEDNDD